MANNEDKSQVVLPPTKATLFLNDSTEQFHGMESPSTESNLSPEKDYRFFVELLTK